MLTGISNTAFLRLITYAYLDKHANLYHHIKPDPVSLWDAFQVAYTNITGDLKELLQWLAYDVHEIKITSLDEWAEFTRRVCYFNNQGSPDLFKLVLPSNSALKLHVRASYVLKLALESCLVSLTPIKKLVMVGKKHKKDFR